MTLLWDIGKATWAKAGWLLEAKKISALKCLWIAGERTIKMWGDCSLLSSPASHLFDSYNLQQQITEIQKSWFSIINAEVAVVDSGLCSFNSESLVNIICLLMGLFIDDF